MHFTPTSRARFATHTTRIAAAAALALALLAPGVAAAEPIALDDIVLQVQFMVEAEPATNIIVVGVRLPEGTALPATVRLPVPPGAEVYWAGELTGGGPEDDLTREFTLVDVDGGQAIEFTAEETMTVQYDAVVEAPRITGTNVAATLQWLQTVRTGEVSFAVRIPAGNESVTIKPEAPGSPLTNRSGELLYTLRPVNLEPGTEYTVEVEYARLGTTPTGPDRSTLVYVLLGLLAVAAFALAVAWKMQHR